MKSKYKNFAFSTLCLLFLTSVLGCSSTDEYVVDKTLNVVVESGDHFELSSNVYKVEQHSNLQINMNIDSGYYINSIKDKNSCLTNTFYLTKVPVPPSEYCSTYMVSTRVLSL